MSQFRIEFMDCNQQVLAPVTFKTLADPADALPFARSLPIPFGAIYVRLTDTLTGTRREMVSLSGH